MLEGAARGVRNVPNSCCKGASEGCCCTLLLLQGAAVRVACPLWSWPAGAAAGCCFKVLQFKVVCALWSWHVSCQDAAVGFFSEAAGGLVERGEWLRRKDLCSLKHKF